ncbi:hypothetical protein Ahy_B08g092404 [Arachis hypogaea]|uniref:Uncharacterized protein n=1 Tax=Arachis hypogaea TaxID=3818 RepID=A0A444Y3U6_ARAHY|nr:hypothetical protein Ahy_B08g092404 [Arachis hypogaea]
MLLPVLSHRRQSLLCGALVEPQLEAETQPGEVITVRICLQELNGSGTENGKEGRKLSSVTVEVLARMSQVVMSRRNCLSSLQEKTPETPFSPKFLANPHFILFFSAILTNPPPSSETTLILFCRRHGCAAVTLFARAAVALCCCRAAVAPTVATLACAACRSTAAAPPSLLLSVAAVAPPTLVLLRSLLIDLARTRSAPAKSWVKGENEKEEEEEEKGKRESGGGERAEFEVIPVNKKNKKEKYQEELEEHIISLISSLFGEQASEKFPVLLNEIRPS